MIYGTVQNINFQLQYAIFYLTDNVVVWSTYQATQVFCLGLPEDAQIIDLAYNTWKISPPTTYTVYIWYLFT